MDKYYRDTLAANNIAFKVMSWETYKDKMLSDNPECLELDLWRWVAPAMCYSNALYICDNNYSLEDYGEWCNYCEGIVINKLALGKGKAEAVHHSFIYSSKYECYVDCTPSGNNPELYLYYISDELKGMELSDYLDSMDECPRFIHTDVPMGDTISLNDIE